MSKIGKLFSTYKHEAFRLETLPFYKVKGEWASYQEYLETGKIIQDISIIKYISESKQMIEKGRRHLRARIIPNPLNDYFIFETLVGYLPQSRVGFEFFFVEEKNALTKSVEDGNIKDFWLFDKSTLLLMSYNTEGEFLKAEISNDKDLISKCIQIRDSFVSNGESLNYILEKYADYFKH